MYTVLTPRIEQINGIRLATRGFRSVNRIEDVAQELAHVGMPRTIIISGIKSMLVVPQNDAEGSEFGECKCII